MANEFVVRKGLIVSSSAYVTGSLTVTDEVQTPQITFTLSGSSSTIVNKMVDENTISWEGASGQIFSITDDETGTIFSVNDSFGIPAIEVEASGNIRLAEFNGNVLIGVTTDDEINKVQISGSVSASAFSGSFVGPLEGTASWAQNADLLDGLNSTVFATTGSNTFVGNQSITGSVILSSSAATELQVIGNTELTGSLAITGTATASALLISGSGTQRLRVIGSGSAQPLFTVEGSQGELFSLTDSLSGSLFSVSDISGLPILEVFSDDTVLLGDYLAPALHTTKKLTFNTGSNVIYSFPTASYDSVHMEYNIKSGSNGRAGFFTSLYVGTSVQFTDASTLSVGSTTNVKFEAFISGANLVVTGSVPTNDWTAKLVLRAI